MRIAYKSKASQFLLFFISLFLLISCGSSRGGGDGDDGGGGGGPAASLPAQDTAPSFNRSTGYFVDPITVTIAAPPVDTTLRVTEDGSNPTCNSGTVLTTSFDVSVSTTLTTIKALFCKDDFSDSAITEATFTIPATVTSIDPGDPSLTPIQDAIDDAFAGDIIFIPAGTYTEDNNQIDIYKNITLMGHGTEQASGNTILNIAAAGAANPIFISTGGASSVDRLAIRNMVVTGDVGTELNGGTGIKIGTGVGHVEFDNVTATGNYGNGIAFDVAVVAVSQDIRLINSTMSGNGGSGFRVPSSMADLDGLLIDNCVFNDNTEFGINIKDLGNGGVSDITIQNSTLSGNSIGVHTGADLLIYKYYGDAVLSNITIDSNGSESGIRITGRSASAGEGETLTGSISLSDITINGMQQSNGTYPAGAIVITRYDDLANLSMNNVVLNSTAPHGLFLGTITTAGPDLGNLELTGTFSDSDIRLGSHGNSGSSVVTSIPIDAAGATFSGALTYDDIEDRVYHSFDDSALGTVSWTSP